MHEGARSQSAKSDESFLRAAGAAPVAGERGRGRTTGSRGRKPGCPVSLLKPSFPPSPFCVSTTPRYLPPEIHTALSLLSRNPSAKETLRIEIKRVNGRREDRTVPSPEANPIAVRKDTFSYRNFTPFPRFLKSLWNLGGPLPIICSYLV